MLQINNLANIIKVIIAHQAMIIGPLAIEQANKVIGLKVKDGINISVEVKEGDPDTILTSLVKKYEELFGRASVEVCKDAVKELKPSVSNDDLPAILR
jgi:hypothetical protein